MVREMIHPQVLEGELLPRDGNVDHFDFDEELNASRRYWQEQVGVRPDGEGGFEIDEDESPEPNHNPMLSVIQAAMGLVVGTWVGGVLIALDMNFLQWLVP